MIDLSRNHVIEAGAGTGKTYNLVQALLQALFQKGLPLTSIVALTFTKKAAGEMKERVADELRKILAAKTQSEETRAWGHRLEELQTLARAAMGQIDRAQISTIHSFSFSLLKRFPLAAGINPEAEVDEKGLRYADIFDLEWPRWLTAELRLGSPREKEWMDVLSRFSVADIEDAARLLSDFRTPLQALPVSETDLPKRLQPHDKRLKELAADHSPEDKTGRLAVACEAVLGRAAKGASLAELPAELLEDVRLEPGTPKSWSKEELREIKFFRKLAHNLLDGGDHQVALLTQLLRPFVERFRSTVLAQGYLSNDALLALACELVRDRHDIRETLKREFRMILIDEFQDTDPLQGELLLFLAEQMKGRATRWTNVQLEPGKLFVVGDPKQSIYRFRGADISAYRQITDVILAQGGLSTSLQKSWRSHEQIIHVINRSFSRIIQERKPISPAYVPLEPQRPLAGLPLQTVELCLANSPEPQSSEDANKQEADHVALWIAQNVGAWECLDKQGNRRPLQYKDIALIFRSTPAMRTFLESLRAQDIPFVVEGERYFYSTPEVKDLINFLRVIENPRDRIALVGFLRSPLGGFTDAEILDLKETDSLNATHPLPPSFTKPQLQIWELLQHLHARVGREPLKALLQHIFEESFVLELAARSYHRDQTIANILKLKRLLESFAEEGVTTFRLLLAKVKSFMEEDRLEGESPLADETYDAVRLLTAHKSKGLEFPVVILPSLHSGRRSGAFEALSYDWSTGRLGLRVAGLQNLEKFVLDWETQEREREEEKRVLYVAMTRARERLMLSGGIHLIKPASDSYLEWLGIAWELPLDRVTPGSMERGPAQLQISFIEKSSRDEPARRPALRVLPVDFSNQSFANRWQERAKHCQETLARKQTLRPSAIDNSLRHSPQLLAGNLSGRTTLMDPPHRPPVESISRCGPVYENIDRRAGPPESAEDDEFVVFPNDDEKRLLPDEAKILGTLIHRFLEQWDFSKTQSEIPARLRQVIGNLFASAGLPLTSPSSAAVEKEAQVILDGFVGSESYNEIKTATILGREIPFFYAQPDNGLMRGSIDLLYRLPDGTLIVADYKTDRLPKDRETASLAARYQPQVSIYREAIQRALGEKTLTKLIFLRASSAITI
ncbi:MAG: UvrD-helicase domain-containing protein [Elusimicrobiota bacterium]|jgi:ATP-dependent helicase/nuclease subunit A